MQGLAWQASLKRTYLEQQRSSTPCEDCGTLLLLQHPPVYTLGAGSSLEHALFDPAQPPLPLFRTERGGEITHHGPGQLVVYPVIDLRRFETDLHWYMRRLEDVVIRHASLLVQLDARCCKHLMSLLAWQVLGECIRAAR